MLRQYLESSWIALLPVVILVVVAVLQITFAQSGHLVSWKGGGFGMFATIDAPDFRDVRLFDATGRELEIASEMASQERRVRTFPNRRAVLALVALMDAEEAGGRVGRAEIWQTRFAGSPLRPHHVMLVRVDLAEP